MGLSEAHNPEVEIFLIRYTYFDDVVRMCQCGRKSPVYSCSHLGPAWSSLCIVCHQSSPLFTVAVSVSVRVAHSLARDSCRTVLQMLAGCGLLQMSPLIMIPPPGCQSQVKSSKSYNAIFTHIKPWSCTTYTHTHIISQSKHH